MEGGFEYLGQWIGQFIDVLLHLDKHLDYVTTTYGAWTYLILGTIVFCETGLVITPILPGDSLLFAAGAFAARGSLGLVELFTILSFAAIAGDAVNYGVGKSAGAWAVSKYPGIFRPQYLQKTEEFFARYGNKTIVIARFIPIVRTFAPFLAGAGSMPYLRFAMYNVVGGLLWVGICVIAGYFFGNLEFVKRNFTLVILAIILISVLPALVEFMRAKVASPKPNPPVV